MTKFLVRIYESLVKMWQHWPRYFVNDSTDLRMKNGQVHVKYIFDLRIVLLCYLACIVIIRYQYVKKNYSETEFLLI